MKDKTISQQKLVEKDDPSIKNLLSLMGFAENNKVEELYNFLENETISKTTLNNLLIKSILLYRNNRYNRVSIK